MAITLNLAPEEENRVRQKARGLGREAENYVAELVLRDINSLPTAEPEAPGQSLAEALEGFIGVLDSGKPGLAEKSEDEWGKGLVEQYRSQGLTLKDAT